MKAAPFAYVRPSTTADVVAELVRADANGGGKIIAGGQSLVPVLAMRLGRPATLIDLTGVAELNEVSPSDAGLQLGAAVRQRRVEHDHRHTVPLLSKALPWIGHREIRSRGTVCGSLAHADPSAELPAVALCLGATFDVAGPRGRRQIPAADFFTGAMRTALDPTEVLTSVNLPIPGKEEGFGFAEISRRHGDFALAGVAVRVRAEQGRISEAIVVSFGVSDRPQLSDLREPMRAAADRARGDQHQLSNELADAVAEMADQVVTTGGDSSGSPAYRRRLIRALTARELSRAHRSLLDRTPR